MFTGIVSDVGTVAAVTERSGVRRVRIDTRYAADSIAIGASMAIAGVCLTVVSARPRNGGASFEVEAAPETLAITTAEAWKVGTRVNLERSLKVGDELGGHIVSGHVDGTAAITERHEEGAAVRFALTAPAPLARFIAAKGSVALVGASLTVNAVDGARFDCLIIPFTLAVTTWGERRVGDRVNLEVDTLARYLARLLERAQSAKNPGQ
jgi:riboflavin synthase